VLRGGHRLGYSFLDIRGLVGAGGERGLLSIAFPPDYPRTRRFYAYYTDLDGNIRVDEFRRRSAQQRPNKDSLLGKLLRIDPRPNGGRLYTVPADNPFVGRSGRGEIYSYGLRNPFRFSFDTVSAKQPRIAIADVGQNRFEELDYVSVAAARGANFGWDAFEGNAPYTEENGGAPTLAGRRSRSWPTRRRRSPARHQRRLPDLVWPGWRGPPLRLLGRRAGLQARPALSPGAPAPPAVLLPPAPVRMIV
jgi:glucose/arabinose dehydrogenase